MIISNKIILGSGGKRMKKGKLRHFFMGILLVALLAVSTAFVCTACRSSGGEPLTVISVEKTGSRTPTP